MQSASNIGTRTMTNANNDYFSLSRLGYLFLGPIIGPFVIELCQRVLRGDNKMVFLSREGYHLKRIVRDLLDGPCNYTGQASLISLEVSRSFLFKMALSSDVWREAIFVQNFSGTIRNFLTERLLLPADCINLPPAIMEQQISLPQHQQVLAAIIEDILPNVLPDIDWQKKEFLGKIDRLGLLDSRITFADLGFSGTIQNLLARLYGIEGHGIYMLLNREAFEKRALPGSTAEGYWSESARFGKGDPLVDYSLIMESVLSAPHGQYQGLSRESSGIVTLYGPTTAIQRHFHMTYAVMDGVRDFAAEVIKKKLDHKDIYEIVDVRRHYEIQLQFNNTGEMKAIKEICEVDDRISGMGLLRPFSFFGFGGK